MLAEFRAILDDLKKLNIFQFGSYISGSQYLGAYNLVKKYSSTKVKVLDWGTGSGHFSYFLLKQGHSVDAFTIEKECNLADHLIRSFPEKYKILLNQNPLSKLPYGDRTFDMVVSIGVLEHVRDTYNNEIQSLKEIRRILKTNGIFICYHFPNKYSWIEAISKYINSKYNHNFKFTKKDIKELNLKSDLELIEFRRYGIMPRNSFRIVPNYLFLAWLFNLSDNLLSLIFNPFCQNYYFVSRRKDNS